MLAARDAEVEGDGGAELERGLEDAHFSGVIVMPKKPPPPNSADREPERVLARAEVELRLERLVEERHLEVRAEGDVGEAEHADREVGDPRSKPALMPSAVTSRYGGSLNPSNGMISLSVLTNDSGPANSMPSSSRNTTLTSGFLPGATRTRSSRSAG